MRFGHAAPMKRDTIFRIASITKAIPAVAAIVLVEECKLRLDDSMSLPSEPDDTVPALRAITSSTRQPVTPG
jgi:CubicO group peptidase (beta-lactamase class C family)